MQSLPTANTDVPAKKTHKRINFTPEEDTHLRFLVSEYGENKWGTITAMMKNRNIRQCKERWYKYLSPEVKNNEWTEQEDQLLIMKWKELGPKWKEISKFFNGRTDINIKSRYNVLKRKMIRIESLLNDKTIQLTQKLIQPGDAPTPQQTSDNDFNFDVDFDLFDDTFDIEYPLI